MSVTVASVRIPLLCLVAMLAVLVLAAPAADAKGRSRGTVCAATASALRPSPLRTCARVRKAPKALPSVAVKRDAAVRGKRRRALESSVGYMMG